MVPASSREDFEKRMNEIGFRRKYVEVPIPTNSFYKYDITGGWSNCTTDEPMHNVVEEFNVPYDDWS